MFKCVTRGTHGHAHANESCAILKQEMMIICIYKYMCNIILIIVIFDIKSIISIIIIRWYLVCAYENKKGRLQDESFLVRPIFDAPITANSQSLTGELPRVSPDKVDPRASYVSHINIFEEPVLFEHRRHHSS